LHSPEPKRYVADHKAGVGNVTDYAQDTIRTMQIFGAVAKLGSFSAAGRLLGMAPSSVSRRIDALQAAMGAQLINRTSRKLTLTDAGAHYYEGTSRILKEIADLNNSVADLQSAPKGVLHIHTRARIGVDLINPALPKFLKMYPDIKIKLWLDEEWHDLIEHKIDIAIRIGNISESGLCVKKLLEGEERFLIASPGYLAGNPPITDPDDLQKHNCLTWDPNARTLRDSNIWHFRSAKGKKDVRVTGSLFVNHSEVLKSAVLSDLGIAMLPGWCVNAEIRAGLMKRVLPNYEATSTVFDHQIYAVFQNTAHIPRKIRVFLDFYHAFFKSKDGKRLVKGGD